MTAVAAGEVDTYRNLEPKSMIEETKSHIEAPWDKKIKDGLGTRHRPDPAVLRHEARDSRLRFLIRSRRTPRGVVHDPRLATT